PRLPGRAARLDARLRGVVLPDAGAVALPRVRGRPRRGGPHRPPERAGLGTAEDLRPDAAGAAEGPARRPGDERVLHHPREREELARQPVLDASAGRAAHRAPAAPRAAAPGHAGRVVSRGAWAS